MKFFVCEHCGNLVEMVRESGVPIVCCGQNMTQLVPNTTDAAREKHVPVVAREGQTVTVRVGSTAHPMLENHYIQWIVLETKNGVQRRNLRPGDAPEAVFVLPEGDEAVAAYAYCNLHGLWMA